MSRPLKISIGEFYHLYNRGVDKREIFLEKSDYERFISLLYFSNSEKKLKLSNYSNHKQRSIFDIDIGESLVSIGAYCLMPNHFHLLIYEKKENGISLFMQRLLTAYTMYFNKKYNRTGSLFQGTYKSQHADTDRYFKYLFSYIHLNPVKLIDPFWKENGLADINKAYAFLDNYLYSSFLDYKGLERKLGKILSKETVLDCFENKDAFIKNITEWLEYKDLLL